MYTIFYEFFPSVAEKETMCITLLEEQNGLPAGTYVLTELYCEDKDCDCQRVFLSVFLEENHEFLATITYGFKNASFYRKWAGYELNKEDLKELMGPALNRASVTTKYSNAVLELVKSVALKDEDYIKRLKRHYKMVKDLIAEKEKPVKSEKIERNSLCSCGSGKKYKKCCINKNE